MYEDEFNKLFLNMCCNFCKHDFNDSAIKIKREEKGLFVLEIVCPECKKSFGTALLGFDNFKRDKNETPFEFCDCPLPVNYDDVLNVHNLSNNCEEHWKKYIRDNFDEQT